MDPRRHFPATLICAVLAAGPLAAHEAWLLTPSEVEALVRAPTPWLFTSSAALGAASALGCLIAFAALRAEDRLAPLEARVTAPLARRAAAFGPLAIRLGLAAMLALAALGLSPRHGTAPWAEPTLFVPDMQLSLAPGFAMLAPIQLALAGALAFGLATRLAGLAVIALALGGLAAFGAPFLGYAPHFAGPGLMLAALGGGAASLDRALRLDAWLRPGPRLAERGWATALALLGLGFVYLAIACKLTQPTLLMAILEHGAVPVLGLPLDLAALVMAGVELIAGAMLAIGRLTRPVALFLIGAFSFFALTIGETPLFHANLYGVMLMLTLSGPALPAPMAPPAPRRLRALQARP